MSETETTGGPPAVKWVRGTSGTISVGRARVKGEPMVELIIAETGGHASPHLITAADALALAARLADAAQDREASE